MLKIPKGEMCMGCVHLYDKCNHLCFEDMKVIERYDDCHVVRCTEYVKPAQEVINERRDI